MFKNPPFSAKVFEAKYAIAGGDLLPISSTTFIELKFQSCSVYTVGLDCGTVMTAAPDDVTTIRCTLDLKKRKYKYASIKLEMHTRF